MKKRTIPLRVCSDNPKRFIPEKVDKASEKVSNQLTAMMQPFLEILSAVKNEPVSIEMQGMCNGLIHAFNTIYNLPEKSTSYVHEDPKACEQYRVSFRQGFETGVMQNAIVDGLMRQGLGYRSYTPIIYDEKN